MTEENRMGELIAKSRIDMAKEIEELRAENNRLALIVMDHEMADYKGEVAELKAAIEELVADAEYGRSMRLSTIIAEMKGEYNPAPVYTSNCIRHPGAPHGVDVDASWRAGHTVCVCQSWAPGDAS